MKIAFVSLPAYGHLYPIMPLATACRDAGHAVVIVTGEPFSGRLADLGWSVRDVSVSIDPAMGEIARRAPQLLRLAPTETWRMGIELFAAVLAPRTVDPYLEVLRNEQPDLVVYEETALGAPVAAGLLGLPAVRHSLGPPLPRAMQDGCADLLRDLWSTRGGEPPAGYELFGEAAIDLYPGGIATEPAAPLRRIDVRPEPWEPTGESAAWPTSGARPLVFVSFGTTAAVRGMGGLRAAVTGLAALDVDVVTAVGPAGDLDALRDCGPRVRVERFVPQEGVLRSADLVVHHGGSGTTLGAMRNAVPQLVIPQGPADQLLNGRAVANAGVGTLIWRDDATADAVADAAGDLLSHRHHREAAVRLAGKIAAMPSPAAAVRTLAALAVHRVGHFG